MSTISHLEWLLIFVFLGGFLLAMFDEDTKYRIVGILIMVAAWLWVMTRV
jgi:hypothetical protein